MKNDVTGLYHGVMRRDVTKLVCANFPIMKHLEAQLKSGCPGVVIWRCVVSYTYLLRLIEWLINHSHLQDFSDNEKGQMQKRNDGSYTLVETDDRTEVTYAITIDLSIPMLGMIKRKAEKVILDTALKELKKRVEG